MYRIEFAKEAVKDILKLRKSDHQSYKKFEKIIAEIKEHPYTGTGHPEPLKYLQGMWSRKLDKKNRIRYTVNEEIVTVYVVSALGHYDDK
jgi:toxin YoeB